jgi:hypothetical protein
MNIRKTTVTSEEANRRYASCQLGLLNEAQVVASILIIQAL